MASEVARSLTEILYKSRSEDKAWFPVVIFAGYVVGKDGALRENAEDTLARRSSTMMEQGR